MRKSGRPTMVDVAADAGVSLKTVSRVINAEPHVDEAMTARVHASIERLSYHRNALAASLRSGTRDTIGFLCADMSNTFSTTVGAAVSTVMVGRGMQVIMASSEEDAATEHRLALDLSQRRVGGLIIVPSGDDQGYLAQEIDRGVPVVFVDRPGQNIEADAVLIDNRGGARAAMTELLEQGHRRVAMLLDAPEIYTMRERRAGALEAFSRTGVPVDDSLVIENLHTPRAAREALDRLLDAEHPPTAVFCANNRATIGALEAALPRNSRIDVTGFDDFEVASLLPRRIRIVAYDTSSLGTIAAETLIDRIFTRRDDPATTSLIPTRLVDRGGGLG